MPISIHSENLKAWNTHASAYIKYQNQILFQKWQGHEILKENFNLVNFRAMTINIKITKLCSFMNFNLFSYTLW